MSKTTQEWMTFENLCSDTEGREAVAEVVRLRRALEDLRDTLSKARIDIARGDYEYGQHTAFLMASSRLTRILEGGNDERPADDTGRGAEDSR